MNDAKKDSALRAQEELALLRRYRIDGDEHARDELVAMMLPWVRRVAMRYSNRGQDPDDLIQVGSVGLLKAIERFDFDRGVRLTTFAEPNVTGEIKRFFRDHGWSVRPPRDLQEQNAEVMRAIDILSTELQHSPKVSEIAGYLNISDEQVLEAMHAGGGYDTAPLVHEDSEDSSQIESKALATDDAGLRRAELLQSLGASFADLSDRDREIVHMRFYQDLTQSEIADRIGVSQMQVSRILRAALNSARETLGSGSLDRDV
ncbi:MAG: SigB/SigF/SigG family RNA polymerase sigma factor [Solirubrobacterales bacterium]